MRFAPQRRAIFRHLNFKKWSGADVFCTFSLENVLLATAACNFSTSQLQKVVRNWDVLYIFTWKCASRHSGVQFFLHLNFKKCSEPLSFLAFSCIFTSKCASRHSGVQFLISPLTTWLRTRRFNEPTFRLTRHTNHWKNTAFRDFSNIWRGCIFFLLTFALLHLLSSDSTSSSDFTFFGLYFIYLLFICFSTLHIVGSLLFKLPSIMDNHSSAHPRCHEVPLSRLCTVQHAGVHLCIHKLPWGTLDEGARAVTSVSTPEAIHDTGSMTIKQVQDSSSLSLPLLKCTLLIDSSFSWAKQPWPSENKAHIISAMLSWFTRSWSLTARYLYPWCKLSQL